MSKQQTITINNLIKYSKKSRRTLMDLIRELKIEILDVPSKNKKTNEKAINLKYVNEIILYIYCTDLLGRTEEFAEKNLTIRNQFSYCLNKCKGNFKNDYSQALNSFIDALDNNVKLNLFLTRDIRKFFKEELSLEKTKELLTKMANRYNAVEDIQIAVFDTSFLLHRPSIISSIINNYNKIIIPKTVFNQLNNIKDDSKNKKNKNANLVMSEINENQNFIFIEKSKLKNSKNYGKIFDVAKKQKAKTVHVFSDNTNFKINLNDIPNIKVINTTDYDLMLSKENKKEFDRESTRKLIDAVNDKKINIIKNLLNKNVDINAFNNEGLTPLMVASINGSIEIVKLLLKQKNIEIDKLDVGKYKVTALGNAVIEAKRKKNTEKIMPIIKLLVNSGANINKGGKGRNFNNTPLLIASWNGNYDIVNFFINKKYVSINQVDSNGFSPLIKATIKNNFKIVPLLIRKKADKNIYSFEDKKAIDYCLDNIKKFEKENSVTKLKRAMKIMELLND